ncbi:MAG: thiamine phosphate synthase [Vulcanimicrobiaceae bacterium]
MSRLRGIYAIVDAAEGDVLAQLDDVLAGGVRLVQYRCKSGPRREILAAARQRTQRAGAMLIVNDAWELVDEADGVHLGQEDLDLTRRASLREGLRGKILGISCPDVATAKAAAELGADYLGVGSIYPTGSKADAGKAIGPQGVRAVVDAVDVPVAAIGGIALDRIPEVRDTGAAMAAVISAISRAPDRRVAARALVDAWAR